MKRFVSFVIAILIVCLIPSCSPGSDTNTTGPLGTTAPFETEKPSGTQRTESNTTEIHEASTLRADKTTEFTINIPDITTTRDSQQTAGGAGKYKTLKGKPSATADTFTGLTPLPEVTLNVTDPTNLKKLSTQKIEFSYGVAKGGVASDQTKRNQAYFDSKGFDAIAYDNNTAEKVLYLTFDCGYENGYTTVVLDTLKEKKVPAAFFCTLDHIKSEPELIARMIKEGHIVGNHSTKHPSFSDISRTKMAAEIQTCDNYLRQHFGYSSPYFRFPKGDYSESALDLVQSVGFKSVFWSVSYADWDVNSQKGSQYAFETVTSRLHPGAIILLHSVSKDNAEALDEIIDWAREHGYKFKSLES
jgi:peptidoglycan-N-acetylmuramic acid deacetylase